MAPLRERHFAAMDVERAVKAAVVGAAALFLANQLLPGIPLALIPHESAALPDPARDPLQTELPAGTAPMTVRRRLNAYRLFPRAAYDVSARVVGTEPYVLGGAGALMPWDLALTWGDLTKDPYLSRIAYTQFSRFYGWSTRDGTLDLGYIGSHSANVHVIPASGRISSVLSRVRRGDLVRLEGELVDADGPHGFRWSTSLSRTDSGPGACETMYVRALTVGRSRYR